jgi:hypothetical protein
MRVILAFEYRGGEDTPLIPVMVTLPISAPVLFLKTKYLPKFDDADVSNAVPVIVLIALVVILK